MAAKQPGSVEPQIVQKAARLYKEVNEIRERFFDLESRVHEHEIVIQALEPLDNSRKCCRLMGGVLVERTVGQVLPTIKDNKENLSKAMEAHKELLQKKSKELADFSHEHGIQVKASSE